jgi:hypothetical protein
MPQPREHAPLQQQPTQQTQGHQGVCHDCRDSQPGPGQAIVGESCRFIPRDNPRTMASRFTSRFTCAITSLLAPECLPPPSCRRAPSSRETSRPLNLHAPRRSRSGIQICGCAFSGSCATSTPATSAPPQRGRQQTATHPDRRLACAARTDQTIDFPCGMVSSGSSTASTLSFSAEMHKFTVCSLESNRLTPRNHNHEGRCSTTHRYCRHRRIRTRRRDSSRVSARQNTSPLFHTGDHAGDNAFVAVLLLPERRAPRP